MIKAVLFDLDGTVADSLYDLADNANMVLKANGYPTHNVEKYKTFVGNGIARMLEAALPDNAKDAVKVLQPQFMESYAQNCCNHTKGYEGVGKLLATLKTQGIKIALVTNKAQPMAKKIVSTLYPGSFDIVCGQVENRPPKPDPAGAFYVMRRLGVCPDECVFVGDSNVDIACGINCGAHPCGVLWGFRTKEELLLSGAKFIIEKPTGLLDIIKRLDSRDITGGDKV